MVKIEMTEGHGTVEVSGNRDDVIIEVGFVLYDSIKILRDCGKSNTFIKEMFMIALNHEEDESDD